MITANYHTHTPRCGHAFGEERGYIEQAITAGYKLLGFSDHTPQPYPEGFISGIRMDMSEITDYTDTLTDLKDEYKDRINILIGYEVEYSAKYFKPLMRELEKHPLDYIIQGQHYAPDEPSGFYAGTATDDEDRLKAYVDITIEGMKTGLFTYLAHPDLINFTGDDDIYKRHMCHIIETAIDCHIPLEINMLGFLLGRNYPSDRFFEMASKMGADFVIGCDAHKPEQVMQPEGLEGFMDFLKRNNIECGDNTVTLRH